MDGPFHREQGGFPTNPRPFGWVGSGTPPTSPHEDRTLHHSSCPLNSKGSPQQSLWYIFGFALPLQSYFQLPLPKVSSVWSNWAVLRSGSRHIFRLAQPPTCPGCVSGHRPSTLAIVPWLVSIPRRGHSTLHKPVLMGWCRIWGLWLQGHVYFLWQRENAPLRSPAVGSKFD